MFFWFFILTLASFPQRVSSFDSSPRSLVLIPSWITYSKRPPWHHFVLLSRPSYLSSLYQFITSRRMVPNCRSILPRTAKAFSGCIDQRFAATSSDLDTYWHIPRYSTALSLSLWPSWALAYRDIDGIPDLKRDEGAPTNLHFLPKCSTPLLPSTRASTVLSTGSRRRFVCGLNHTT